MPDPLILFPALPEQAAPSELGRRQIQVAPYGQDRISLSVRADDGSVVTILLWPEMAEAVGFDLLRAVDGLRAKVPA